MAPTTPIEVVVHPIVLLSVVDHYDRVAKGTSKRVVGTLLGEVRDDKLHILSSYAVPFEEEARDPQVWFLDHNYHEQLAYMQNKVNAKEKVVGWYSSGPKIKPADLHIHEIYRKFHPEPVFIILDVVSKAKDLAANLLSTSTDIMEVYTSVKEMTYEESFSRTFKSVPGTFGCDEAEEVGTEHLLRDIRNRSTSTLANRVHGKCESQKMLISKLEEIKKYLADVRSGKFPYNGKIVDVLQEIFNKLPESCAGVVSNDVEMGGDGSGSAAGMKKNTSSSPLERSNSQNTSQAGEKEEINSAEQAKYLSQEANDQYLGLYTGAVMRSILTLHNLVTNKIAAKEFVKEVEKEKREKEEKEKAGKEGGK